MDDNQRDELLLAVADAVQRLGRCVDITTTMPLREMKLTWAAFDRLRDVLADAKRSQVADLIKATEESEC